MRLFESKRADTVVGSFTIIELLLLAIIAVIFMGFINDIRTSTVLEKNYLARDIALLIDTAYAAPGAVKYVHPGDASDFIVVVEDNLVKVREPDDHENLAKRYPFADLGSETTYATLTEPEDVVIIEGGQQVFVVDDPDADPEWKPPPRGALGGGPWTGQLSCPQTVYETMIKTDDQKEVAALICEVADAYGAPGNLMLAIGWHESRFNKDAISARVGDPGMGIFQLTCDGHALSPPYPCIGYCRDGVSKVDGGSIDYLNDWRDNIECGILFFYKSKCGGSHEACLEQSKRYCCKGPGPGNYGTACRCEYSSCTKPVVEKDVVYTGYDRGLRGYNGWGCYASSVSFTWEKRHATQTYVERLRETEQKFAGCCG